MARKSTDHFAAWRSSGLSIAAYCKRAGISRPTLYYWRRKSCGTAPHPISQSVPISFTEFRLPTSSSYVVRFSDICSIEIPRSHALTETRELIAAVMSIVGEHKVC